MKNLVVTAVFAFTAFASSSAVSVDSKRLLGYFEGSPPASPTDNLSYLNVLLDHYNGGIGSLPSVYQLAVGVDVPDPILAKPVTHASGGEEVIGVSIPIAVDDYDWVSLRTGNKTGFYYIGDLSGSHSLFNGVVAGPVVETAEKLKETKILIGTATTVAKALEKEEKQLDLDKLLLEAEKQKKIDAQKEAADAQELLEKIRKALEAQMAALDDAEQEKKKELEELLKKNAETQKQKKLDQEKLEEEKKKLDAANKLLELEKLKKQQELQKQLVKKLELEKEKKRLEDLKKAQLEEADDILVSQYHFFGEKQRPTGVPESGATFALLALALAALGSLRRRR